MIQKVERLISEINRIHKEYSIDYFETGKVQKVNLKHTFSKVPTSAILAYRLNLHESINVLNESESSRYRLCLPCENL